MALINCSECGSKISEKASVCPKCGCPLDITKQAIKNTRRKRNKKIAITVTLILIIVLVGLSITIIGKYKSNPANIAIHLVKKDFGNNIDIEKVYYNSEINGCVVKFSISGKNNTATVHLDDNTVGYQSVLDEYTEKSESATSDNEKQKYAEELVKYMDVYNFFWEYDILVKDPEESGWEMIENYWD